MVVLAAACQDVGSPAVPPSYPPLDEQAWYVHVSDGQVLPALIGHRVRTGGVLEQDFLDSARVVVHAGGTWELAGWYQRLHDGWFTSAGTASARGTWRVTTDGYEFRGDDGGHLRAVVSTSGSDAVLNLDLPYSGQEGVSASTLRPFPTAPTVVGAWRATTLSGQPLPAAYVVEPEVDFGRGPVSRHIVIDSARMRFQANQRYAQRVFYSEWEGPAHGAPQVRLYSAVETDFGSWDAQDDQLLLRSGWLQNKVISGDRSEVGTGSLLLNHGITHGDPPAAFTYARQ